MLVKGMKVDVWFEIKTIQGIFIAKINFSKLNYNIELSLKKKTGLINLGNKINKEFDNTDIFIDLL